MIKFHPITRDEIKTDIQTHLGNLPSPIDSFLEGHILESSYYTIEISGSNAGFVAIHKGSLITLFVMFPEFRKHGQAVFAEAKKLERVRSAFVLTGDEFFLSHALDSYQTLAKQAYFFAYPPNLKSQTPTFSARLATADDIDIIQNGSGDFFGDRSEIETTVNAGGLFMIHDQETYLGFGIIELGQLIESTASIGLFVIPEHRNKGVGTATLQHLLAECEAKKLRPVAGCGYYNHLSKKTLERAGMFTQTRLLKIGF